MIHGTLGYLKVDGKTLFLHRHGGEDDTHNGFYVTPGGHTEPGERGLDCIRREFLEETGLTIEDPKLKIITLFDNRNRVLGGRKDHNDWFVNDLWRNVVPMEIFWYYSSE